MDATLFTFWYVEQTNCQFPNVSHGVIVAFRINEMENRSKSSQWDENEYDFPCYLWLIFNDLLADSIL